jgi:hypothetical protein
MKAYMADTVLYYPCGPRGYIVSRARDCQRIGTVTRVSQDWRSRRAPSWRFECAETGALGTTRTRREAAMELLEVFEQQEGKR